LRQRSEATDVDRRHLIRRRLKKRRDRHGPERARPSRWVARGREKRAAVRAVRPSVSGSSGSALALVERDQPDGAAAVGVVEITAELVLEVARHGPLSAVPPLEPALEVLGDDLVERRFLRAATLVATRRRRAAVWAEAASRGKPCDCGDRRAAHYRAPSCCDRQTQVENLCYVGNPSPRTVGSPRPYGRSAFMGRGRPGVAGRRASRRRRGS
jgi:hypothetical protein